MYSVWDIKFIKIEDTEFDLNNIEHGILRKNYNDPWVHFVLVCGSMSCPKLQNSAFTADKLDEQLNQAARTFINDPFRNKINDASPKLSKILNWYWMDFKNAYLNRAALVNKYSSEKFAPDQKFEFLEYDWTLNEQTDEKRKLLNSKK